MENFSHVITATTIDPNYKTPYMQLIEESNYPMINFAMMNHFIMKNTYERYSVLEIIINKIQDDLGDKAESGYQDKAESGYQDKAESGYQDKAESGYQDKAESGYRDKAESGYRDKAESGYRDKAESGYRDKAESGYQDKAESGYRDKAESGYQDKVNKDQSEKDTSKDFIELVKQKKIDIHHSILNMVDKVINPVEIEFHEDLMEPTDCILYNLKINDEDLFFFNNNDRIIDNKVEILLLELEQTRNPENKKMLYDDINEHLDAIDTDNELKAMYVHYIKKYIHIIKNFVAC